MAVEGATGLFLYCWEMFSAEMTPLLQAEVLGDTHLNSRGREFPGEAAVLRALPFVLYPPAPSKAQGPGPRGEGLPICISRKLGVWWAEEEGLFGSKYC